MLKHVGRHRDKKVVIVFRTVPGEDHMALVIYPDNLNATIHDDLMNAVQSNEGQAATNLGDALFRIKGTSGDSILHTIHREGFIKKVRKPVNGVSLKKQNIAVWECDESSVDRE